MAFSDLRLDFTMLSSPNDKAKQILAIEAASTEEQ